MPSDDGYPNEDELKRIRDWEPMDGIGLIDFVRSIWWNADWGCSFETEDDVEKHQLSTGGWSGNEEIITTMRANWLWWSQHWYSHRCGGHYEFHVKTR